MTPNEQKPPSKLYLYALAIALGGGILALWSIASLILSIIYTATA
jgi:hypothetical protein